MTYLHPGTYELTESVLVANLGGQAIIRDI